MRRYMLRPTDNAWTYACTSTPTRLHRGGHVLAHPRRHKRTGADAVLHRHGDTNFLPPRIGTGWMKSFSTSGVRGQMKYLLLREHTKTIQWRLLTGGFGKRSPRFFREKHKKSGESFGIIKAWRALTSETLKTR